MHVHIHTHAQPFKAQHDCWSLGSSVLKFFTFATKCCDMCQNLYICMYTQHECWWLGSSVLQFSLLPQNATIVFPAPVFFSVFTAPVFSEAQVSMPRLPDFRIYFKFKLSCHGCQTSGFISSFRLLPKHKLLSYVSLDSKPQPYNQFFGWFEMPCLLLSGLFGFFLA